MATSVSRALVVSLLAVLLAGAFGCAKPKIKMQVSKDRVQQGEDVRVTWIAENAKDVTLNGQMVDRKSGAQVFTPDNDTTYTVVARRGKKEARDSKAVAVTARPPRPNIRISTDQEAIQQGQSTTLRWTSNNAETVTINDLGTVPPSGSRVVSPSQSTTYTATATGRGGTDSASTRVSVTADTSGTGDVTSERPRTTVNTALATVFGQRVQSIFFDYNVADLRPEAKDSLRRGAEWLTQAPNRSIVFRIEGNCDPRGTEEYNIGLGERRAQAAREFLVSLGVEASRMQTVSYGEEQASGTAEGSPATRPSWAYDRRDAFVYISGGTPPR
jgi:peptidoglycan-associated lipoprotein